MVSEQLLSLVATEEHDRIVRYARAWQLYEGNFPRTLKVRPGQPDDNVTANFVRVIADAAVAFLFGREVSFEISETADTDAEQFLQQVWEANNKMALLSNAALNGALCGHVFLKILPEAPFPRLVVLDPATVTVQWEPKDFHVVRRYIISYTARDPDTEQILAYREVIERDGAYWRIMEFESVGDATRWQIVGSELWRWDFPPIVDCQNLPLPNSYYGQPDITEDIINLNTAINFLLSNMSRIVRYHAHPRIWAKGVAAAQLNVGIDEAILLPSPEASLNVLEMRGDLGNSIELYLRLKEIVHEASRTPEVALGKLDKVGAISGIALRILYQPILQKTESKRRLYGAMLQQLNRRLLAMAGFGNDVKVNVHWPELVEADDAELAKTAVLWQQLGVSEDTILRRLGFDPEVEREKRELNSQSLGEHILTAFERGQ